MKSENEKKGIFTRLIRPNKIKKSPCCGSFVVEEIPEENKENEDKKDPSKEKRNPCCG